MPAGPAMLALRTGAVLLPTAVYSGPGIDHTAVIMPPVPTERTGRLRQDVARVTQLIAADLEQLIRRAPEQWHLFQPNWPSDSAAAGPPADRRSTSVRVALLCPYSLSRPGGVQGQVLGLAAALTAAGHDAVVLAPADAHGEVPAAWRPVPWCGWAGPWRCPPTGRWPRRPRPRGGGAGRASGAAGGLRRAAPARAVGAGARATPAWWRAGSPRWGRSTGPARASPTACSGPWRAPRPGGWRRGARCRRKPKPRPRRRSGVRYEIIGNGIDLGRFASAVPWPVTGPTVLFVGRHEPRKGLDVLLEAAASARTRAPP